MSKQHLATTTGAILLALLLGAGPSAYGQGQPRAKGKPSTSQRLDELTGQVDRALKDSADSAAALKVIQELQNQITALKQEVKTLGDTEQGFAELRQALKKVTGRIARLEGRLVGVRKEMQETQFNAGFRDDGFFLRSPMKRFMLKVRGFLQASYLGQFYSEEYPHSTGVLGETTSTFLLSRARLELGGHVITKFIKYRLELDLGSADPGPVLQAYGDLRIFGPLQLRFGRQKIPVSRQFLVHSAYQQFTQRSGVVQAYAPGWDLGLVVHGEVDWLVGPVHYQLGIFNGAGDLAPVDDNADFLYTARLVYEPLGRIPYAEGDGDTPCYKVAIGGSFAYNLAPTDHHIRMGAPSGAKAAQLRDADGDGNIDNVGIFLAGAELTARLHMVLLHAEMFYRMEDPGAVGPTRRFWGAFGQLGTVPRLSNWELAVRYGYREPAYYGQPRSIPRPEHIHEVSGVLNVFAWKRRLKWQAQYTFQYLKDLRTATVGAAPTTVIEGLMEHQIQLQTSLYF